MSEVELKIVYQGEGVQGSMDVMELAPALLAFGEAFQEANREVNGELSKVTVRVRDQFESGSFDVFLQIDHSLLDQAKTLLFTDNIKSAKDIAILLGFSVGMGDPAASLGAFHVLKKLKGLLVQEVPKPEQHKVELHIENVNQSNVNVNIQVLTVDETVAKLIKNPRIRKSFNSITKPLDNPTVQKLEIQEGPKVVETVGKEDRPYFHPLPQKAEKSKSAQRSIRVTDLEVVGPVFKEGNKWRVSDGNATFSVQINDQEFLKKVKQHQITFGRGDIIRVQLQQSTKHNPEGLKTNYTILEVLEKIGPSQLPF